MTEWMPICLMRNTKDIFVSLRQINIILVNARRNNDVIITSKRRRDIALTCYWRYCVVCPLGCKSWKENKNDLISLPMISLFRLDMLAVYVVKCEICCRTIYAYIWYPTDTRHNNNVIMKSKRRRGVILTLILRHVPVGWRMCCQITL